MRRLFALLALLPILGAPLFAADDEAKMPVFPDRGTTILGPYHVLNKTGPRKNYYHCLVCSNGLNPVAAIFVQPPLPEDLKEKDAKKWLSDWTDEKLADDAPLCKLFKKLDTVAEKNPDAFMGVYAIFLAKRDDKEKIDYQDVIAKRLEELPKALHTKVIVYGVGNTDEPKSRVEVENDKKEKEYVVKQWFEKKDFETGVLLYQNYKVLEWHPFKDSNLSDKDIAAITKEFDSLVPYYARPGYRPKLKLPKQ
jgi:hypothetical protein